MRGRADGGAPDARSGGPLTDEAYWSAAWSEARPHDYEGPVHDFAPLFARLLPRGPGLRCLELGCAPGFALVYLAKEFGYAPAGVDASPVGIEIARAHAARNGVDADLRVGDLFSTSWDRPFDVVFSAGLVEHFEDPDPVVARHLDLLRPGGTLVLSVPNLRGVHRALFPRFAPDDWAGHNPRTGSPYALRAALRRLRPGARTLYCGYWETFRLYYPAPAPAALAARAVGKALRVLGLARIGNRWFSPHGYLVARVP